MTATDIAVPGEDALPIPEPGPFDDWIAVLPQVARLAETVSQSPFVPDALRGNVPATTAAILAARELHIPPMTGLANIHVIKGKTGLSALMMRALILAQGHEWQDVEVSDTRVVVRGRRRGEQDWTEASFTIEQARAAGIQSNGYPQDKLYARATCRLARRKFADVIAGMPYSAEELADGDFGSPADDRRRITAADITGPQDAPGAERVEPAGPGSTPEPPPGRDGGGSGTTDRRVITKNGLAAVRNALDRLVFEDEGGPLEIASLFAGRPVPLLETLTRGEGDRILKAVGDAVEVAQGDRDEATAEVWRQARLARNERETSGGGD